MLSSKTIACMMTMLGLVASTVAHSQEKDTVSIAVLRDIHEAVQVIAEDIAEQRQEMDSAETAKLFFQNVVESQKRLEPVIILIAETNAPRESQLYAISVAIAAKETELALWHYICGFMSEQQTYLDSADILLLEGLDELSRATTLAPSVE